jgi:hypothetical protein
VQEEDALQTATLTMQLKSSTELVRRITDFLKKLNRESKNQSSMSRVWNQLVNGTEDGKILNELMQDLEQEKTTLGLVLQLANIGLSKSTEDSRIVLADPEVISHVDQLLVEVFGEGKGLKIANLVKERPLRGEFKFMTYLEPRLMTEICR